MVFPTFFNLSLNLSIRSSWSEPQSAPGLAFADCIELLHLWLTECGPLEKGMANHFSILALRINLANISWKGQFQGEDVLISSCRHPQGPVPWWLSW